MREYSWRWQRCCEFRMAISRCYLNDNSERVVGELQEALKNTNCAVESKPSASIFRYILMRVFSLSPRSCEQDVARGFTSKRYQVTSMTAGLRVGKAWGACRIFAHEWKRDIFAMKIKDEPIWGYCCENCFDKGQKTIRQYIHKHGEKLDTVACPYCGKLPYRKIALSLIGDFISNGIERAYEPLNEGLYDDDEKGYFQPRKSIIDILLYSNPIFSEELSEREISGKPANELLLSEMMVASSQRTPDNPFGRDYSDIYGENYFLKLTDRESDYDANTPWDSFVELSTHCHVSSDGTCITSDEKEIRDRIYEFLDDLYDKRLQYFTQQTPERKIFHRARVLKGTGILKIKKHPRISDIGPAPYDIAGEDRMSPKGISYRYLADKAETARAEARANHDSLILMGKFHAIKTLRLIDWTWSNVQKRLFDIFNESYNTDGAIYRNFIFRFMEEVKKPKNDDDDSSMYIPTQLIACYLRSIGYDGIQHESSLTGGNNIVLFYGPEQTETEIHSASVPVFTEAVTLMKVK